MTHHDHVDPVEDHADASASAADAAPGIPDPPTTGDPRVDAALEVLPALATRPVADHVEAYEDVHRQLHDALADLDGR